MYTKSEVKTRRFVCDLFLIISLVLVGFMFDKNAFYSILFWILAFLFGIQVDRYNNQLEKGEYEK